MMDNTIKDIIKTFEPDSKNRRDNYDQLLIYIYRTFDKKINFTKSQMLKDKYKSMRQGVLEYIVSHKRQVIKELSKRK
jgi:uncharacterized protein (DUF608 family)|tara:strand:+ start:1161 stop:1394 length:234 start_codon:yes stop_codon:yes gene_type:complete